MKFLFNFGVSQDDAVSELLALEPKPGDRLICLASAGEVALNLLTYTDVQIDAVDISLPQLHLARLKLTAALHLDSLEAAKFLGYMQCPEKDRMLTFNALLPHLDAEGRTFWEEHPDVFKKGPIHAARFEQYIAKFNGVALFLVGGRKKMIRLCQLNSSELQEAYFDEQLRTGLLKIIFRIVFHPRLYKNRGMDNEGLKHSGERNIADFFFSRFRSFCTSTPARKNYYLQMSFFNRILFHEALPEYLQEDGIQKIKKRRHHLSFKYISLNDQLESNPRGTYNKFALSNIGDWLSGEEYQDLLQLIVNKAGQRGRIFLRYIHFAHPLSGELKNKIIEDNELGRKLEARDRYPFYSLLPMSINTIPKDE